MHLPSFLHFITGLLSLFLAGGKGGSPRVDVNVDVEVDVNKPK